MKTKKRSPREVIESSPMPEIEHTFVKHDGEETEDITNYSSNETQSNHSSIQTKDKYTHIHTHPTAVPKVKRSFLDTLFPGLFHPESRYNERREIDYSATPSSRDMDLFLKNKHEKTMVIAVREPDTGKIRGYTVVRKTKNTPTIINSEDIAQYRQGVRGRDYLNTLASAFQKFTKKYNLNYRFLPAENYEVNREKTQFIKKGLEKKVALVVAAVSFLGSLFTLYPNLNGNVIGQNMSVSNSISLILFIIGIISTLIYFKVR